MIQPYQPLHQKYRPERFDELVGQDAIKATLKEALNTNRIAPAYLFSGPRGTGKTSSARILAKSLNCLSSQIPTTEPCGNCDLCKSITLGSSLDVIEIDAASNTGVENIRELIERSRFAPVQARWKVYVIDECHMLSTAAFNALLKTLEEPPKRTVFVLATTDPQRVLPTILSRCQRFDFKSIPLESLKKHLEIIAKKEEISIENDALLLIAQRAQGGLRDAESMLDQLSLLPQPIEINSVWDLLGAVPEKELLDLASALSKNNPIKLLETSRKLVEYGREPLAILQGLAAILRDLVLLNVAPDRPELSSVPKYLHSDLLIISKELSLQTLLKWQENLKGTENEIRQSFQPRLWLEILLLGLLSESDPNPQNIDNSLVTEDKKINSNSISSINSENNLEKEKLNLIEDDLKKEIEENKITEEAEVNLSELWQQILGKLELPSTRMLLSQQARLTRLTADKAFIQVSSNWLGMVQSRISLLEDSITQTLGTKRKLIIDNSIEKIPQTIESKIEKIPNNPDSSYKNSQAKDVSSCQDEKGKGITKIAEKIINNPTQKTIENIDQIDNGLDDKAQKFADFFNGKVIDIDSSV